MFFIWNYYNYYKLSLHAVIEEWWALFSIQAKYATKEYQNHYSHVDAKHHDGLRLERAVVHSTYYSWTALQSHLFWGTWLYSGMYQESVWARRICDIPPAGGHLGDKHIRGRLWRQSKRYNSILWQWFWWRTPQNTAYLFHTNYSTEDHKRIYDTIKLLQQTSAAEKSLLSEIIKVARFLLVMPATNAVSERTFSSIRRLKSYLRTTMTQERMNSLMILHTHKEHTDSLNLKAVANDFCSKSESRKQ